jgi:hypothetical protein
MLRTFARLGIAVGVVAALGAVALVPPAARSQNAPVVKTAAVKVGKGEKVCRVKLKYTGEVRTWVCKKEEPCCVWHEINYVKCGSTITGCL